MNRRTTVVDRAAEQLVNMDNANYADERERAVYFEAHAFGMQLILLTCWLTALVLAVFGTILAPLALTIAPIFPALGTHWYSHRRGVNLYRLMARGPIAKSLAWAGFYGLLLFTISAALVHRAYYGEGLLDASVTVEVVGQELQYAIAVGAIFGVGLGALVGVLYTAYLIWHHRRAEKRELQEDDDDAPYSSITPATSVFLLIAGVITSLLSLIPILFGPANHFAITLAVLGLLYGAAMTGLYVRTKKR